MSTDRNETAGLAMPHAQAEPMAGPQMRTSRGRMLRTALGVAAATVGAGTLLEASPQAAAAEAPAAVQHGLVRFLTPVRIVDTRSGLGGSTVQPGQTLSFTVAGANGVPRSATGMLADVTVIPTAPNPGFISVFPATGGSPLSPISNNVSYAGDNVADFVVVGFGPAGTPQQGQVSILVDINAPAMDILVDLYGYIS